MNITALRTEKITRGESIFHILDRAVREMPEKSVLAITSKIVAISEGSTMSKEGTAKEELVMQEADSYLPSHTQYNVTLTIKNGILIPSAGIDESNADNQYVLWPRDAQRSANAVREYLIRRFGLKQVGVIITDSKTTPLRWGTTGIAIAHSGFQALNSYIGKPDLFGRTMKMSKANIMDGLAAAAVVVMGEGDEQTPLALIEDIPFCQFQDRNPTEEELRELRIELEDDLYAPLLKGVEWKKGKKV